MRPIIEHNCQYFNKSRRKDVTITRLQLGRCGLYHYLHQMKRYPDGKCNICNTDEKIAHFILYCRGQPAKEIREWQDRNHSSTTLEEILNNKECQEVIFKHASQRKIWNTTRLDMAADASSPTNVHNKKKADCVTHAKKINDMKRACMQGELRPNASGSTAVSVPDYTLRPIMS